MSEPHTPPGGAPPADEEATLGAGNVEPDPATAETPPDQLSAGDKKREKGGAPDTEAESGVGGSD